MIENFWLVCENNSQPDFFPSNFGNFLERELRDKIWWLGPKEVSWGALDRWDTGLHSACSPTSTVHLKSRDVKSSSYGVCAIFRCASISNTYPRGPRYVRPAVHKKFPFCHHLWDIVVADMEVDTVSDMVADNKKIIIDINMEIQFGEWVGHGVGFGPQFFLA